MGRALVIVSDAFELMEIQKYKSVCLWVKRRALLSTKYPKFSSHKKPLKIANSYEWPSSSKVQNFHSPTKSLIFSSFRISLFHL